ncbi:MAG: sodium-dependent transporter [Anaerohalosphaeraceae bacterium]|nr:sodium-dependent transporter [Anaerohalosphaeraceae bacterium]
MEMLEQQRENWGSRGGFILAAVGSAVGLGNLWGFPYKIYSYGGGAFLIPYILAIFIIGIPMLAMEFSLGHFTQRSAPGAFGSANRKFEFVGWWSIILGFVIITYYPVILGYCFSFLWLSIKGIFNGGSLPWAQSGVEGVRKAEEFFYDTYLAHKPGSFSLGAIRWNIFVPLVVAWLSMYLCICKGVKLVGKIVWLTVPLPWLMLLILAVRGLTLEGSIEGLVFYLNPSWEKLAEPTTWRFAFGQVFFSLSLAFGVMVTYASFLHKKSDINNNAAIIGLSDFATSFVAGIAIFATLGGMAFATAKAGSYVPVDKVVSGGPGLAFVAFPYALAQLPYSAWFSFIFFFALVTLGIDSAFSITESILTSVVEKTRWSRSVVLIIMSFVGLLSGIVYTAAGGGLNWLGTIDDFINGTWGIAFVGLLECIVLGWIYRLDRLRVHANERSDFSFGKWWNYLIRIIIPIVLGTLFFWSMFDDFSDKGFFIKAEKFNIPNIVGLSVVAVAPILAIVLGIIGSPFQKTQNLKCVKGYTSGWAGLILALISTLLMVLLMTIALPIHLTQILTIVAVLSSLSALIMTNYCLDNCDIAGNRASASARIGGIVAILNISVIAALTLIRLNNYVKDNGKFTAADIPKELTGVSYIILGVVSLLIIGGLGWCFYKAIVASGKQEQTPQLPQE